MCCSERGSGEESVGGKKGEVMGLRYSWRGSVDSFSLCLGDYIIKAIPHYSVVLTIHHSWFITLQYSP